MYHSSNNGNGNSGGDGGGSHNHNNQSYNYNSNTGSINSSVINSAQAWSILKRHARNDMPSLRLQELCRDTDRVASLVAVHSVRLDDNNNSTRILMVDMSRQHVTNDTMQHLLRLSKSKQLHKYIQQFAWGPRKQVLEQQKAQSQQKVKLSGQQHQQHQQQQQPIQPQSQYGKETGTADNSSMPFRVKTNENTYNERNDKQPAGLPSMHMSLRIPRYMSDACVYNAEGENVLTMNDGGVFPQLDRLQSLVDSIRKGQYKGATGCILKDVVVIGRGVAIEALRFLHQALQHDERAFTATRAGVSEAMATRVLRRNYFTHSSPPARRLVLLTSIDPVAAAQAIEDLDPASTLVVSIALKGNEETGIATKILKTWLLQHLSSGVRGKTDTILSKHMMLVTANDLIAKVINKPESVHLLPEICRCEAWTSCTAATILPLGVVYGWSVVTDLLLGAHDIDQHFVTTNPRHNLPVLLALMDVWNDLYYKSSTRVVTPFSQAMTGYTTYCAALESHACGRDSGKISAVPMIVAGDPSLDRVMYQGPVANAELLIAMDTQVAFNTLSSVQSSGVMGSGNMSNSTGSHHSVLEDVFASQDAALCACFAHADELALGPDKGPSTSNGGANGTNGRYSDLSPTSAASIMSSPTFETLDTQRTSMTNDNYTLSPTGNENNTLYQSVAGGGGGGFVNGSRDKSNYSTGNRPSIVICSQKMDAFGCGQLIALAEHRAMVKAHMWDIDPFYRDVGSSMRLNRTENLREELQEMFRAPESLENDGQNTLGTMTMTMGDNSDGMNLSTKTILEHYANLMREQRGDQVANAQTQQQYFL